MHVLPQMTSAHIHAPTACQDNPCSITQKHSPRAHGMTFTGTFPCGDVVSRDTFRETGAAWGSGQCMLASQDGRAGEPLQAGIMFARYVLLCLTENAPMASRLSPVRQTALVSEHAKSDARDVPVDEMRKGCTERDHRSQRAALDQDTP